MVIKFSQALIDHNFIVRFFLASHGSFEGANQTNFEKTRVTLVVRNDFAEIVKAIPISRGELVTTSRQSTEKQARLIMSGHDWNERLSTEISTHLIFESESLH